MPSKKKKYNARFPPARIKKIMQTDEEVGKVAAAVPVIISRALELFIDSLIEKTASVTREKHAKTLSASHIKQAIHSEKTFDFLRDLVKNVPDHQAEDEDSGLTPSGSGTQETKPKPIKPSRIRELHGSERSPSKRGPGRPRKIKIVEKKEALSADNDSEETDTDEEQNNTERVQEPSQAGNQQFFSPPSCEPTQAGNQQFFSPPASEPTQAGNQHFFSPATTDDRLASSASPGQSALAEHETHTPSTQALSTPPLQQTSETQSMSTMSAQSSTLQSQVTTQQANTVTTQPTQTSSNMPYIPPNMSHMQPPGPIHPPTVNPYPMHNMPIPPYPFPVQIPPYNPPPFIPNTALNNSNSSNPHLMPPMMPPFMPPFMNMPHQGGFYMPPLPPPGPEGGSYLQMLSDAAFRPPLSVGLEQSKAPPTYDTSQNTRKPDPPHSVQSGSSISGDTNMPLDMSLPSKSRSQRPTDSQEKTIPNLSNQNDFMPGTTHPPHNMLLPKTYDTSTKQSMSKTSVASDQNSSQNGPDINPNEGSVNSNDLKKSRVNSQSDNKSGSQIGDNKCVPIKKQKNSDQNSIQYENLSNLMSRGPLKIVSNEDDDDYDT